MTLTERGRTSQRRRGAEAGDLPRYPGLQAGGGAAGVPQQGGGEETAAGDPPDRPAQRRHRERGPTNTTDR